MGDAYEVETTRTLPSGPAQLGLRVNPEELARLNLRGRLALTSIQIQGPRGFGISSRDHYAIERLPPSEGAPFRYAGQTTYGFGSESVQGSFSFLTPGGICSWKGEVEQDDVRIPFAGQAKLNSGQTDIPFRVKAKLKVTPGSRAKIRVLAMECSGRIAFPNTAIGI
jgi:hypothetical protein